MNKVFLIGNLTKDLEMRSTQSGVAVCNFTIAVNRRFRNQQTGQQETDFLNVIAWRQLAELCGKYLSKGRKVAVMGSIQTRTYEAKDGSKRTAWDIVADEVEFLAPQNQQSSTQSAPGAYTTAASKDSGTAYAPQPHNDFGGGFTQVDDEELPF
uniref:Single-stranded DNA-binding protein n=1 Tax=Siphoviridae sp. ct8LX107 TaxID=2826169 RepID=A0A8S5QP69_9CAUD|nr:MAG TPA: Single strand binding protein [Siphoviridae sp. ct8LX107]